MGNAFGAGGKNCAASSKYTKVPQRQSGERADPPAAWTRDTDSTGQMPAGMTLNA